MVKRLRIECNFCEILCLVLKLIWICLSRTLKRLGGNFIAGPHLQVDGDKFICMDSIAEKDSCIIYSFGINDDWTFEDLIDKIGIYKIHWIR